MVLSRRGARFRSHFPLADRLEISSRRQLVSKGAPADVFGAVGHFSDRYLQARPAAPELALLGAAAYLCTGLGPRVYIVGPHTI